MNVCDKYESPVILICEDYTGHVFGSFIADIIDDQIWIFREHSKVDPVESA